MTLLRQLPSSRPTRATVLGPVVLAVSALVFCASAAAAQVRGHYLYTLSSFAGRLPYDWARIHVDQQREETYVIYRNLVRVFNASGMEVFSFGDDLDLGLLLDVAIDEKGDINLLSQRDSRAIVTRCNFRGEPVGTLEIRNLPAGLEFNPHRMVYRNGRFYFATTTTVSMITVDGDGMFRERVEFLPLIEAEERLKVGAEMVGFAVDGEGNVFFTIPVLFKAFKYSPDKSLTSFGRPGSAPGRFGIVSGIARDSEGHIVVVDKLRCVVMVFDADFNFLTEFGSRGTRPENLIVPDDVVIDRKDRLYVTQGRMRGISVFALKRQ